MGFKILGKVILFQFFLVSSLFAQYQVPHNFEDGQVASASKVNENFNYAMGNRHKVYSNGSFIGYTSSSPWILNNYLNVRLTEDLIFIQIQSDGILKSAVYYKSNDCTGIPYFREIAFTDGEFVFNERLLKLADVNQQLYYAPKDAQLYRMTSSSMKSDGNCLVLNQPGLFSKLLPNDPNITGISSYPFTNITVEGFTKATILDG